MGIEVEVRAICNNPVELEKKLSSLFPLIKQKHQVDEYFSHPLRDFYSNPDCIEYLRIRNDGSKFVFAYHKAFIKNGVKTHTKEHELSVEDPFEMKEILLGLSFRPFVTVSKDRKVFDGGDFELVLSSSKNLVTFWKLKPKKILGE